MLNQAQTTTGCSPLWQASQQGHVAIVKVLLEAGSNVNQHANNKAHQFLLLVFKDTWKLSIFFFNKQTLIQIR